MISNDSSFMIIYTVLFPFTTLKRAGLFINSWHVTSLLTSGALDCERDVIIRQFTLPNPPLPLDNGEFFLAKNSFWLQESHLREHFR